MPAQRSKSAGESPCDNRVRTLKQDSNQVACLGQAQEGNRGSEVLLPEERRADSNEGALQLNQPSAPCVLPWPRRKKSGGLVQEKRSSIGQAQRLVPCRWRPHRQLQWKRPLSGLHQERELWAEVPGQPESRGAVACNELANACEPSRAVANTLVGSRWDIPALDHLTKKTSARQPLSMDTAERLRRYGTRRRQGAEDLKRLGELFVRGGHEDDNL